MLSAKMRLILGALLVSGTSAYAQGTFAHIAFGGLPNVPNGFWQTTFTFVNLSTTGSASIKISFYNDDGSPLSASIAGVGNVTTYQATLLTGATQTIVLSGSNPLVAGWANVESTNGAAVRGQGDFRQHVPGKPDFEAVVPLTTLGNSSSNPCIIPFPNPSPSPGDSAVILVPFDNTGGYTTSIALSNISTANKSFDIEFDTENNSVITTDTLNMNSFNHTAFATTDRYPSLAGQKGLLRIKASAKDISVIAFLFNNTGPFTTVLPIIQ
jgi:hypothetical protein